MVRLIFLSDFTEAFPHILLQGILSYAKENAQKEWVVCRMPPSFKSQFGIEGVLEWAKNWKANAMIGRFDNDENVSLLQQNGITVIAQDYKRRFTNIPNITSDYLLTGQMAAEYFLMRGFKNFAFFGYENTVWSDERCIGFSQTLEKAGYGNQFHAYTNQQLETLWYYDTTPLVNWLQSLPPKTALLCCDDNQGNKITEVCKFSKIKIPNDIAVLGVDNDVSMCELSDPPLSSINLDIERAGYDTASLISFLMKNPGAPYHDVIIKPTSIINRISTNIFATDDKYIMKTLEFIHNHLDEPLGVEDLVKRLPLSRRLLEIRFKKITGKSVYQYILQFRMLQFAKLIQESTKPIVQIADEMGFNNYANLSKQFKLLKGCTPIEYRKKHQLRK